jgi:pimeloyl-ACP methyl ester carboxylesterase
MDRKPLVVGHSMGGAAITAAAVLDASAFSGLVYLAAFVPLAGDSVAALGARDTASLVPASVAPALGGLRVRPSRARALFYAECSEEDAAWATAQLRVDPLRPLFNRVRGDVASSLARAYVECTRDRAVSIGRQRAMLERAGIRQVFSMQTDHSPFLSAPEALAAHLDEFASGV